MEAYDDKFEIIVTNTFKKNNLTVQYQVFNYPPSGVGDIMAEEVQNHRVQPGERKLFPLYKEEDYLVIGPMESKLPDTYLIVGPREATPTMFFSKGTWKMKISRPGHQSHKDFVSIGENFYG